MKKEKNMSYLFMNYKTVLLFLLNNAFNPTVVHVHTYRIGANTITTEI